MKNFIPLVALAASAGWFSSMAAVAAPAAHAAEWPMFRGPNGSGTAPEARPPVDISATERVAWKVEVSWSPSSPVVAGERLFLTTFADKRLETRAYATSDGRLLWSRNSPYDSLEEFHGTEGSPAAGSPATDGTTVVSYFGSSGLVAYDVEGKELWRQKLPVAATSGNFGSGTSPLLHDGRVILNRDVAGGPSIFAFDLKTGAKLWETPRVGAPTSYGTPAVWSANGTPEIIVAGSLTVRAYDPVSGSERWHVNGLPSFACTTPVFGDGLLFFAGWAPGKADSPWPTWASTVEKQDKNGDGWLSVDEFEMGPTWFKAQDIDGNGRIEKSDWETIGGLMKRGENVLLAIKPGGVGDVSETHVAWRFTRGLPYVPSPLHYDGRIYLVKDGGMMSSFDAKTGKAHYVQERLGAAGNYYASPVGADGHIYLASLEGKLTVVKAGGDTPEVVHRADFGERVAGTPALAGNRLYLRTESRLFAFERSVR
ncbi:MAG: PQQ-binding-like beta-propeller repeat protein [Limisphaerales bacterium]